MKFTSKKKCRIKIKKLRICKDAQEAEHKTKKLFTRMKMNLLRILSIHHHKMRIIKIFVFNPNLILFTSLRIKRTHNKINNKINKHKILIIPLIIKNNCQKMYFLIENLKELRSKSKIHFKYKN